jgi:DNA-binding beta-propeller fold protein YncE
MAFARVVRTLSVAVSMLCPIAVLAVPPAGAAVPYGADRVNRLWVDSVDGTYGASDLALSPDGGRVFVTGTGLTVAYERPTGLRAWTAQLQPDCSGPYKAQAVATSPDSGRVFVTGYAGWMINDTCEDAYTTVAYDAATGKELWRSVYSGPGGYDEATAVAVSPDGTRVVVTGISYVGGSDYDPVTVGYSASTGDEVWVDRYASPGYDVGEALAPAPRGTSVYAAAWVAGGDLVVAYDPDTGQRRWVGVHDGDTPFALAVSPQDDRIFVTGLAATTAFDAGTGDQLWSAVGGAGVDSAVSGDGSRLFVAGAAPHGIGRSLDYHTVALDSSDGNIAWTSWYDDPAHLSDSALGVAVSPIGRRLYVTGSTEVMVQGRDMINDLTTVAYDVGTGQRIWVNRYDGQGHLDDEPCYGCIDVGYHGFRVFVAGRTGVAEKVFDDVTIKYRS